MFKRKTGRYVKLAISAFWLRVSKVYKSESSDADTAKTQAETAKTQDETAKVLTGAAKIQSVASAGAASESERAGVTKGSAA